MQNDVTTYRLTARIVDSIAIIARLVGRLEGVNLQQPNVQLKRQNRIRTIQASLAIEGNTLTQDQVTAVLENRPVIGPQQDILEVKNAIAAYQRLTKWDPLSIGSFLRAHHMMMKGLVDDAGKLRQGPIGVVRENDIFHEAPPWQQVEPMLHALFDYLRASKDHLLIKSSRFHFQLEFIHPFTDGNGRIGRLWQTRILMLYHPVFEFLPVEQLIREQQSTYYQSLAKGDDTADCTEFVAFILDLVKQSLQDVVDATRGVALTAEKRLDVAETTFGHKPFSRKDYQNLIKTISTATASRDLSRGVKSGILNRSGDRRTAVYRFI